MDLTGKAVAARQDVLVREIQGESVLLNLASESYFGLDDIGTRMWHALLAAPSVDEACAALVAEYEVAPERLREDVEEFVERLAAAGLIDIRDV